MINQSAFEQFDIEIISERQFDQLSQTAVYDAIDNFALIVRESKQFKCNYHEALQYGKQQIFSNVEHVYVIDTTREIVDELSFEYPEIAALISYDRKNRQWLYFDCAKQVEFER